jgi:RimJ/RimL family protein N-acetyltransferase
MIVTGERVSLGGLRREDIPTMTRWFQNLEYSAYLGSFGRFLSLEDETEWFERNVKQSDTSVQFGIFENSSRQHIGNCGLFEINPAMGSGTLGIGIGEPEFWGRGFGAEAVRLLVEYGMYFRNLHSIRLNYFSFNARAGKAYAKAGFREVGRIRETVVLGGERFDEIIMDITRPEVDLTRMREKLRLLR